MVRLNASSRAASSSILYRATPCREKPVTGFPLSAAQAKAAGLTWNAALETGGILVGDEVTITLEVQFVKA